MSRIITQKLLETRKGFAGRLWSYDFQFITNAFEEDTVASVCGRSLRTFAATSKTWDREKNSEWIARIFLSARLILSASVFAQTLNYSKDRNIRAVVSYLEYYIILSSLRAVILTNSNVDWANGAIISMTHSKTINVGCDIVAKLDRPFAEKLKVEVSHLKAFRELISYRAPSSGDAFPKLKIDVLRVARILAELAQMQSELVEQSVAKHATGGFELMDPMVGLVSTAKIEGFTFSDDEDRLRLRYLQRQHPCPTSILNIISEGHVEEFFGSWLPKKPKNADCFDPDDDWRILFNFL